MHNSRSIRVLSHLTEMRASLTQVRTGNAYQLAFLTHFRREDRMSWEDTQSKWEEPPSPVSRSVAS